jgi:hypothetical protein
MGSAVQPGIAGEFLPGDDLRADGVEVAEDGIDGIVAEREAQRGRLGVQRGEDGGRRLGRVARLRAVARLGRLPGRADGGGIVGREDVDSAPGPALLAGFCGSTGVGSGAWVRPDLRIG